MRNEDVFEKLASELTHSERQTLLSGILKETNDQIDTIDYHPDYIAPKSVNDDLSKLSFFQKAALWFKKIFSWGKIEDYINQALVANLGRRLSSKTGLISRDGTLFYEKMKLKIEALAPLARFFINSVFLADQHKSAFMAFLARVSLGDFYEVMIERLNPDAVSEAIDSVDMEAVKTEMDHRLTALLETAQEQNQGVMDANVQLFFLLKVICELDFPGFSYLFTKVGKEKVCRAEMGEKFILSLADVAYSIQVTRNAGLFEALYLFTFYIDDRLSEVDEVKLKEWVQKGYTLFNQWADTIESLQLRDLAAFLSADYTYKPKALETTDGWVLSFKKFWEMYKKQRLKIFSQKQQFREVMSNCLDLFQLSEYPWLKQYGLNWEKKLGHKPKFATSLAFAQFSTRIILDKMSYYLKIVIKEGQFYKKQNQQELDRAYQYLTLIDEAIQTLETQVEHFLQSGALQQRRETQQKAKAAAGAESVAPPADPPAYEVLQPLEEAPVSASPSEAAGEAAGDDGEADAEAAPRQVVQADYFKNAHLNRESDFVRVADRILVDFKPNLQSLHAVLNGVLYGEVGSQYDSISNISYLGGGRGQAFIDRLTLFEKQLASFCKLYLKINDGEVSET